MDALLGFTGFIAIVPVALFVYYKGRHLHKNEYTYYWGAGLIALIATILSIWTQVGEPPIDIERLPLIYELFFQGHLTFALFMLVMFAGAFKKKTKPKITLMMVRREMAIIGFFFLVPHAAFLLLTALGAWNPTGSIAFLIMVPLFITSFPKIRRKMHPLQWRKLHKAAYAAYAFIYAHLLTINLIAQDDGLRFVRFALYTIIFIVYTYLKFNNYILPERKKQQA